MVFWLMGLPIAQAAPVAAQTEIVQPQEVRPLPGKPDNFAVLNSNSPELLQSPGILVSTFPSQGKQTPIAHLNYAFEGRFDIFAHHIYRAKAPKSLQTLYHGVLLHNPGSKPVKVLYLQANSYLSHSKDAPFVNLPAQVLDPGGRVYAGPGSRVVNDVLRRQFQDQWPTSLEIPPRESRMLMVLPIPNSSGRSTWMRLWSNGGVYAASLASFGKTGSNGKPQPPSLEDWRSLVVKGDLAQPRDKSPTSPAETAAGAFIYGRVAGVSQGSEWQATLTDRPGSNSLHIPPAGKMISYAINTLDQGTLGTGQVQSAQMLARYPDTAYRAHGNYGLKYSLTLPLYNSTETPQQVALMLQTPIKEDQLSKGGLRFFRTPPSTVFFRGPVRVRYPDGQGKQQTNYLHLVQRRGQQGQPLVTLQIPPGNQKSVEVDFLYPPDSTPPQVLTIKTLGGASPTQRTSRK